MVSLGLGGCGLCGGWEAGVVCLWGVGDVMDPGIRKGVGVKLGISNLSTFGNCVVGFSCDLGSVSDRHDLGGYLSGS